MKESRDETLEALKDPKVAREHVELLARHIPMTEDQKDALCQDPVTLRKHLASLHNHQVYSGDQVRSVVDPDALRKKMAEMEAREDLTEQEKANLRADFALILDQEGLG